MLLAITVTVVVSTGQYVLFIASELRLAVAALSDSVLEISQRQAVLIVGVAVVSFELFLDPGTVVGNVWLELFLAPGTVVDDLAEITEVQGALFVGVSVTGAGRVERFHRFQNKRTCAEFTVTCVA